MTRQPGPREVIVYQDESGNEPFTQWLESLRDAVNRKRILARIVRLEQGNFGDCEPVGEGVLELRMFFGPGFRVYFGEQGDRLVILPCGGDKGSQQRDIDAAKQYWKEYQHDTQA